MFAAITWKAFKREWQRLCSAIAAACLSLITSQVFCSALNPTCTFSSFCTMNENVITPTIIQKAPSLDRNLRENEVNQLIWASQLYSMG